MLPPSFSYLLSFALFVFWLCLKEDGDDNDRSHNNSNYCFCQCCFVAAIIIVIITICFYHLKTSSYLVTNFKMNVVTFDFVLGFFPPCFVRSAKMHVLVLMHLKGFCNILVDTALGSSKCCGGGRVGGVSSRLCFVFFLLIVFGFVPSKVFHYYNIMFLLNKTLFISQI